MLARPTNPAKKEQHESPQLLPSGPSTPKQLPSAPTTPKRLHPDTSLAFSPAPAPRRRLLKTLADVEDLAKTKLSTPVFDHFEASFGDASLAAKIAQAYSKLQFNPHILADISHVCLRTNILNTPLNTPIMVAPVPCLKQAHPDGEVAVARAAATAGACYIYDYMLANASVADVAAAQGARWLHVYLCKDLEILRKAATAAQEHGFSALVVTCDHPYERIRAGAASAEDKSAQRHGLGNPECAKLKGLEADRFLDSSLAWRDITWLRSITDLPIVLKGICNPIDANLAVKHGVQAIVVSGPYGRSLGPSPVEVLPDVVAAVNGKVPVLVEAGVRSGTDVLKLLALGASGVLANRPVVHGLAYNGESGVKEVLGMLGNELSSDMASVGCCSLEEVSPDILYKPHFSLFHHLSSTHTAHELLKRHCPLHDVVLPVEKRYDGTTEDNCDGGWGESKYVAELLCTCHHSRKLVSSPHGARHVYPPWAVLPSLSPSSSCNDSLKAQASTSRHGGQETQPRS